jgi:hypothetical protein
VDRDQQWYLAMAKLDALASNIPSYIKHSVVDEFHEILGLFATATAQDVSIFRIPEDKMQKQVISLQRGGRRHPGSVQYSDEKYCEDNFFKRRIQEVKLYFANFQPPHKR